MRLLETSKIELCDFNPDDIPEYAILSHTWSREEVTLQLLQTQEAHKLAGYEKIKNCCKLAASEGWQYVWIDTCCIDKTSSAELPEAINSMWRWYENSRMCYAYLSDVSNPQKDQRSDLAAILGQSRWFTRGWTLQELLAPQKVTFYDQQWRFIGEKSLLGAELSDITGISQVHMSQPRMASAAAKMSW